MVVLSLENWIRRIASQHRLEIDLTLGRVRAAAAKLGVLKPHCPVVTVGGTNGKGSTVAALERIWLTAGYRTGAFTSPWLYRFNELIRLDGQPVADQAIVDAFEQIDVARGEISLTQFEFNTLAALVIFQAADPDVVILEVGLGGRFDAVNIIDADVAVITSIALDHMDRLGTTREAIAFEKAGIFRSGRPAVCGDPLPPATLLEAGRKKNLQIFLQGRDFGFIEAQGEQQKGEWCFWQGRERTFERLPAPGLLLQNMSSACMAAELLQEKLPVSGAAVRQAMQTVTLPGRIEVRNGPVMLVLDVAHNPAAAGQLAEWLTGHPVSGKTRAVFSMLADKDIAGTVMQMKHCIDEWFVAPLETARAAARSTLQNIFAMQNIQSADFFDSVDEGFERAAKQSDSGDRIVVFGSFHTVSAVKNAEFCYSSWNK